MTAPRSDHMAAPQHWFSKRGWFQHSETAFKVCDFCRAIKFPKSHPWPTGYQSSAKHCFLQQPCWSLYLSFQYTNTRDYLGHCSMSTYVYHCQHLLANAHIPMHIYYQYYISKVITNSLAKQREQYTYTVQYFVCCRTFLNKFYYSQRIISNWKIQFNVLIPNIIFHEFCLQLSMQNQKLGILGRMSSH